MKSLNQSATQIFRRLIDGLATGDARKVDTSSFMAVHVDRLGSNAYALAHRFEQNGDSCPDPDVEFYVSPSGGVYPTAIDQFGAVYKRYAEIGSAGPTSKRDPRGQGDLADFCDMWMANIAEQQDLSKVQA